MPVGTQKDYYAILGVDRNAKPEQIRKAFHRPCGNSKVSVDFLPVGDGMKGEYSGLMVYSVVSGQLSVVSSCRLRESQTRICSRPDVAAGLSRQSAAWRLGGEMRVQRARLRERAFEVLPWAGLT